MHSADTMTQDTAPGNIENRVYPCLRPGGEQVNSLPTGSHSGGLEFIQYDHGYLARRHEVRKHMHQTQ